MNDKLAGIAERLRDERCRRILIVSHCLLNENTRYLGGAFARGIHPALKRILSRADCGVVQLPCPEQMAWGGVLKPLIWLPLGARGTPRGLMYRLAFNFFLLHTRLVYAGIAARTARLVRDYRESDFEVVGIVGVDGSPTCGVGLTLSMKASFAYHLGQSPESLNRAEYNEGLFGQCSRTGEGLFMKVLSRKLARRGIKVRLLSVSIPKEMNGQPEVLAVED